jgi:hypothetical protein
MTLTPDSTPEEWQAAADAVARGETVHMAPGIYRGSGDSKTTS